MDQARTSPTAADQRRLGIDVVAAARQRPAELFAGEATGEAWEAPEWP